MGEEGSEKGLRFSEATNGLSYKDTSLSFDNGSDYMDLILFLI